MLSFIKNNWQGLLMMAAIVAIIFGVRDCQNAHKKLDDLKIVSATQVKQIAKLKTEKAALQETFVLAEKKYQDAEKKRADNIVTITKYVQTATPKQKRDTLLAIVRKWANGKISTPTDSTVKRDSVNYSQEDNDKILWSVLDGQELNFQREETTKQGANIAARFELLGTRIDEAVQRERNKHYFLGIGRKKGMGKLQETIQYIIETTY